LTGKSFKSRFFRFLARKRGREGEGKREGERERGREGEGERGREGEGKRARSEKARILTCYAFKTCLLLALNF